MSALKTHVDVDEDLVGELVELDTGRARVRLMTSERMAVDDAGLVHGGFIFGLADFAAMCAVNDPHVVLGEATARFIAPVKMGEVIVARAFVRATKNSKSEVDVVCAVGDREVMSGSFTCIALEEHVLS